MPTTRRDAARRADLNDLPYSLDLPSPKMSIVDDNLPELDDPAVIRLQVDDMAANLARLTTLVERLSASPAPHDTPPAVATALPALRAIAHRPYAPLRALPFSGSENPISFLNDVERHYRMNASFFTSLDDPRRVDEARTAMVGQAAAWFDGLALSRPDAVSSWSTFLVEFRRVYLSAQGLDNVFDHLRSLQMTGPVAEFIAEFNARLARCPPLPEISSISDFRRALPPSLANEVDRSRITRFGGQVEWPSLAEIQSSAAGLADSHRLSSNTRPAPLARSAAAVLATPTPSPARSLFAPPSSSPSPLLPATPPLTAAVGVPEDVLRRRAIADDRESRGLCRYCGAVGHKVVDCPLVAEKEAKRKGKA